MTKIAAIILSGCLFGGCLADNVWDEETHDEHFRRSVEMYTPGHLIGEPLMNR